MEICDDETDKEENDDIFREKDVTFAEETADLFLIERVVERLKEHQDIDHQSSAKTLWEASNWACQEHRPSRDVEKLVEVAYVKYLDLTIQ